MIEGEFYFDELCQHLKKWNAPPFVHIHLDDTRIINKVEYDPVTDRFIGFTLPIQNGLPICDAFVLSTYDEIKDAAKTISISAPTLVLFMLCTDAKYNHDVVLRRWGYVETELKERVSE